MKKVQRVAASAAIGWKIPPKIKVYEALGAIVDERVVVKGNGAVVTSSSGSKEYAVEYNPDENAIASNDNGSYWQGYLGYPAIAFLIQKGVVTSDAKIAKLLGGIHWKDLNQQHKNDFDKVEALIQGIVEDSGGNIEKLEAEVQSILEQIEKLSPNRLKSNLKPPKGY